MSHTVYSLYMFEKVQWQLLLVTLQSPTALIFQQSNDPPLSNLLKTMAFNVVLELKLIWIV